MDVSALEFCPSSNVADRKGLEALWGIRPGKNVESLGPSRDVSVPELKDDLAGLVLSAPVKVKRDKGGCLVRGFAVLDDQELILGVLDDFAALNPASVGSRWVDDVVQLAGFKGWCSQGDSSGGEEEGKKLHDGLGVDVGC